MSWTPENCQCTRFWFKNWSVKYTLRKWKRILHHYKIRLHIQASKFIGSRSKISSYRFNLSYFILPDLTLCDIIVISEVQNGHAVAALRRRGQYYQARNISKLRRNVSSNRNGDKTSARIQKYISRVHAFIAQSTYSNLIRCSALRTWTTTTVTFSFILVSFGIARGRAQEHLRRTQQALTATRGFTRGSEQIKTYPASGRGCDGGHDIFMISTYGDNHIWKTTGNKT